MQKDILLYPHEENACKMVLAGLYSEFMGKESTEANLSIFRDTAIKRFEEIGLLVSVGNSLNVLDDGTFVTSPEIVIEGRFGDEEHDYERHSFEVQSGEADGVVGKITEKGFVEG